MAAVLQIDHREQTKGPIMAPPRAQTNSDNWFQKEILEKILEVKKGMDESLKLGRENGEALRNLRTELGVDGLHGRLPQLEQAVARVDRRQEEDHKDVLELIEKQNLCIDELQKNKHEMSGGKKVLIVIGGLLGGGTGAAILGIIAKSMGLIH